MKNLLKYGAMVIAIVFVLISCDTDPNDLGGEFLGIDLDNTIVEEDFQAIAFSAQLNPVQTNNFTSIQLGSYNDPVYGRTTYDFVTQLSLNATGVDFGTDRKLDSVVLSIPYNSTAVGVSGEETQYRLDSVYGNGIVNFKIFRNNYFLNSFDPNNVEQAATYFSDFGPVIDANKGAEIEFLDEDNVTVFNEFTAFKPDSIEVKLTEFNSTGEKVITDRLSPRFRQKLEPTFWKNLILDQGDAAYLNSDSNFQNFFRGLYFQITDTQDEGVLSYLNLQGADIVLFYTSDIVDINDVNNNGSTTDIIQDDLASTYRINIAGTRAAFLRSEVPNQIQTDIANSFDPINGAERLYLNGGEGAMTFIDLFGPDQDNDGEADALTELKRKEIIVNEANLEFFVDQSVFANADPNKEPERIFIYDFETRNVLSDFAISGNGIAANTNHLGRLERDENGNGLKYRIRITRHIENILSGDVDNNRLGLFVSQNVALLGSAGVKNQTQPLVIESIPVSSAISHEGTVLHGNLSSDVDKRLKLKVFYTEVN